jgi:hypothetical protein
MDLKQRTVLRWRLTKPFNLNYLEPTVLPHGMSLLENEDKWRKAVPGNRKSNY